MRTIVKIRQYTDEMYYAVTELLYDPIGHADNPILIKVYEVDDNNIYIRSIKRSRHTLDEVFSMRDNWASHESMLFQDNEIIRDLDMIHLFGVDFDQIKTED